MMSSKKMTSIQSLIHQLSKSRSSGVNNTNLSILNDGCQHTPANFYL